MAGIPVASIPDVNRHENTIRSKHRKVSARLLPKALETAPIIRERGTGHHPPLGIRRAASQTGSSVIVATVASLRMISLGREA